MVDRIQLTGHKQSSYDRKTGEWQCDGARLGSPCENGPEKNGNCPHAKKGQRHACKPQGRDGEYKCNRASEYGGPCLKGPDEYGSCSISYPPCRPLAGNKNKRRKWSSWMVVLGTAFLAILLGSQQMKTWMKPGNISFQHRFSDGCDTCHINSGETFSEWWIIGNKNIWSPQPAQSYSCTNCHEFDGPAMQAHNNNSEQIQKIQHRLNPELASKNTDKIACHQCHKEHKGALGIQAKLDNKQCQNCHQQSYSGFDKSHPEFTNFPKPKQQRPLFDHAKHIKRFKQEKYQSTRPQDCSSCHMQNSTGVVAMPKFDSACANCHLQKDILNVGGKQASAVSWLTVPKLDAKKLAIGLWPNCRVRGLNTVESLSPITLSLLQADPKAQKAITLLKKNKTRFDKIRKASEEEIAAMTQLAWSFKQLLWDLQSGKAIRWENHKKDLTKQQKDLLIRTTNINSDMLSLFIQQFFTDLDATIGANIKTAQGACMGRLELRKLKKQWGKKDINSVQGWYIQYNQKTLELGYRTQQHKDFVQQTLMDQYWLNPENFAWLKEKKKSINCQKCHVENEDETAWVWQQDAVALSTRFSHKPHLILGVSCKKCHQLSSDKNKQTNLINYSDFATMKKQTCQTCHKSGGRSDQCSSCHSYHSDALIHEKKNVNWNKFIEAEKPLGHKTE